MNRFFSGLFDCIKRKKGYFLLLLMLSLVVVVLGVIAAVRFSGSGLTINLTNISYIDFLKGQKGLMSMMISLLLSLFIFFFACLICHLKPFLVPFGILFYLYLIYSQAVVIMSIIKIYGIFNCVILIVLLLIYTLIIWAIFMLIMCELACFSNTKGYFKSCFSIKESKTMLYCLCFVVVTIIFSIVLTILKSYVILLIF